MTKNAMRTRKLICICIFNAFLVVKFKTGFGMNWIRKVVCEFQRLELKKNSLIVVKLSRITNLNIIICIQNWHI